MTSIFGHDDYRNLLKAWIQDRPGGSRGQLRRLAEAARAHPSLLSQVLNGKRDLTPEQGERVASFMGLTHHEVEYFLALLDHARAATPALRERLDRRIRELRTRSKQILSQYTSATERLEPEDHPEFYSDWAYSAVRLATSIEGMQDPKELRRRFDLPNARLEQILNFLTSRGLILRHGERLGMGPARTHLPPSSPMISKHHANWRLQAMRAHAMPGDEELFFSGPLTISRKDAEWVRDEVLALIGKVSKKVEQSGAEELYCINMDWFKMRR